MAECGLPRELGTNTSQTGTNHFGGDGFYRSLTADCLPVVGGGWGDSAAAGVFGRSLAGPPSFPLTIIGARAVRLLSA
jgi:hypothetical protein